jgi:putative membrane protein
MAYVLYQIVIPVLWTIGYIVAIGSLVGGALVIYMRITPYDELKLIHDGNVAAAVSLTGALVGLVLPLAVVVSHSQWFPITCLWAVIALALQLCCYFAMEKLMPDLRDLMEKGVASAGVFLGAASAVTGGITAVCLIP